MTVKKILESLFQRNANSLKLLSIQSAFWSVLGKGSSHFIRVAGNLILTRILFPEAFGLMATASTILLIVQLFSDTGINIAVIQNRRGDEPEFINTAWVINIFRGVILGVIIIALGWPLSFFYDEPSLKYILFIMGGSPIILGIENPAIPLLIKKFRVSKKVGMELTTQLVALSVTIVLAVLLRSVYALAIGYTVSSFFRVAISYIIIEYRPVFKWDKIAGHELFHFGKQIFINTIITAAVLQADVLLIGKFLDMENLSFYNIGKNLGTLVMMFSVSVVSQSYMPAISSIQDDTRRVQRIYQRTVSFFLTIATPVSITLAVFSFDLIEILYDPRYQLAYVSMYWISLASIFRVIGNISGVTFFAIGKPAYETASMAIGLVLVAILIPIGIKLAGLSGAACGMAIATVSIPVIESIFLVHKAGFSCSVIIRPWVQAILTGGASLGCFYSLRPFLESQKFYNLPFMILIGLLSLTISGIIYRLFEGANPFRDYTTITEKP